ncbi:MAG TPA: sugar phosphate isomerase/epimerase family protein [Phycisphaerae bacterium]|nr:sugar phosphate isomerase/epimerase family protein [Phycisphaerae bacterium]
MLKGIQARQSTADEPGLLEVAADARRAGFDAVEPVLTGGGCLSLATDDMAVRRMGDAWRGAGLAVASLACPLPNDRLLTTGDEQGRLEAQRIIAAALDRAAWLGAYTMVVDAGRGRPEQESPGRQVRYVDAINALNGTLRTLAFEAEARAVILAIENPADEFLLSPVEMRDLIDEVGSPWVQMCLNVGRVRRHGCPADWIDTLGPRIVEVHATDWHATRQRCCALGEGDVDWPAVMAAWKRQDYQGPIVCEGGENPADAARRLNAILARTS